MQEEWYLRLSRFSVEHWVEIATFEVGWGGSDLGQCLTLGSPPKGKWMPYAWEEFRRHMIARFVTENKEARWELRELRQTRRVAGCTTKFQELRSRLPTLMDEEAFSVYLAALNPHFREQVGPM